MKASIEFNLDDENDSHDYRIYNSAKQMYSAIWDFDQKLRDMSKYQDDEHAQKLRELLREYLIEHGINHLF